MNEKYIIGIDFEGITLKLNDIISYILILDSAGQESIVIYSFRRSEGFIFVSDVYGEDFFENLSDWIELTFSNNQNYALIF